ncbi:MAG: MFS transporter, partial [Haloechinothrix sp.]
AGTFGRGAPFIALAGFSALVWVVGWLRVPHVRGHLGAPRSGRLTEFVAVVREPNHLRAFAFTFFLVLGTFTVASFVAPFLSSWNGWRERHLLVIYFVAGICTLFAMNYTGRLADRVRRRPLYVGLASAALVMAVVISNLPPGPLWVATVALSLFMVFASARAVPAQAILLGAAAPRVRGAFLSVNTAVQHFGTGVAPLIAGSLTGRDADGHLTGFPLVGLVSAGTGAVSLALVWLVHPATEDTPTVIEPKPFFAARGTPMKARSEIQ